MQGRRWVQTLGTCPLSWVQDYDPDTSYSIILQINNVVSSQSPMRSGMEPAVREHRDRSGRHDCPAAALTTDGKHLPT